MPSVIYTISEDELRILVKNSATFGNVLAKVGLTNKGGNASTLKRRLIKLGIPFDHIKLGRDSNLGRKFGPKLTLEQVLALLKENSKTARCSIKLYILRHNLIPYRCSICDCDGTWNNKSLALQLDHVNGVSNDNRLKNLRFLCPNCHSQTPTFAGKQHKKPQKPKQLKTDPRPNTRKVTRPDAEELKTLVWERPTIHIAKEFGVSDTAIKQWCRAYGITKPPRGYWEKQYHSK